MSSEAPRKRVQGKIEQNKVLCTCGRLVGRIDENGVEFFCRHCQNEVAVDIRESKMTHLMRIAEMIAAI